MHQTLDLSMLIPISGQRGAVPLIICPFAGASRGAFRDWMRLDQLPLDIRLAVYPGRDHRMQEPAATCIPALAKHLVREIAGLCSARKLYVLAGHSMGAQVAFEACHLLEQQGLPPSLIVLSGCQAPHLRGRRLLSHLSDQEFIRELADIGGASPQFLNDPVLQQIYLPALRADFLATESYRSSLELNSRQLSTTGLLLWGSKDVEASRDEVEAWHHWFHKPVSLKSIEGDHFFPVQHPRSFLRAILECVDDLSMGAGVAAR